jgi:flagellar hook-associated protein 2
MGTISGAGVIDVNGIVSQLMTIERRPLQQLARQEASFQAKLSAFGSIKSALSEFQTALGALNQSTTYQGVKATSSDNEQVKVSANNNAAPGTHTVRVAGLAQAQTLASRAFANTDLAIGTGTITIQKGTFGAGTFTPNASYPPASITIGPTQNTLTGIRDAINAAKVGVNATIVNDGTGHRLVLGSTSGAANGLRITTTDGDGNALDDAGLSQLAYDPTGSAGAGKNLTQQIAPADATVEIDGLTVRSASNSISTALEGVTLELGKTSTTAAVITLTRDVGTIKSAVEKFVKAYNDLDSELVNISKPSVDGSEAGVLAGDSLVRGLRTTLRTLLQTPAEGTAGLNRLSDVGITFDKTGKLQLDNTKLQKQLDADPQGIARIFAREGKASDSRVSFVEGSSRARFGTYEIAVTQAARQGSLVGGANAGLTITAGVNDALTATIDSRVVTITLPAQTYASASALAADVQSRLNGALAGTASAVSVTETAGTLSLRSDAYGASSTVAVSGNAAAGLFGGTPTVIAGQDVAGTIGGNAATGNGQELTGTTGPTTGLKLKLLTATVGNLGTVSYFEGITARLDTQITRMLERGGMLRERTDSIDASLKALAKRTTEQNERLERTEARLRKQFVALDAMVQSMSSTSQYLTQQLNQIAANAPRRS